MTEVDRTCSKYGEKEWRVYIGFCWGNMRERVHLEDIYVDGRNILKKIFKKSTMRGWTGFIWLRMTTDGRALVNAVIKVRGS
jgi:hypothetical protein